MGSVCLCIPRAMLLETACPAGCAGRRGECACPCGGSRSAQGKMFVGYSLWQDAGRVGSMAGKSLDQTRVVFLVYEHQAQGRDWQCYLEQ